MKKITEIILELEELRNSIDDLVIQNSLLRQENEKLKKELKNKTDSSSTSKGLNQEISISVEDISVKEIANILAEDISTEVLLAYLNILLRKDKSSDKGTVQHASILIAKIIMMPELSIEGIESIFEDIKIFTKKNKISNKLENRLFRLLQVKKIPDDLCNEIVEYYFKKFIQKHGTEGYQMRQLKGYKLNMLPKNTREKLKKLIDEIVDCE